MTKKILSLFFVMTAIGFMACQRQGSTNGSFQPNGWLSVLPSKFDWRLDTLTKEGHAELIIYENDKITVNKKYTFDFTLDEVSSKAKENEMRYEAVVKAKEDSHILAHMVITETSVSKDTGVSIERWLQTTSKVTLLETKSVERAVTEIIGKHQDHCEELESTSPKFSYPAGGGAAVGEGAYKREPQK